MELRLNHGLLGIFLSIFFWGTFSIPIKLFFRKRNRKITIFHLQLYYSFGIFFSCLLYSLFIYTPHLLGPALIWFELILTFNWWGFASGVLYVPSSITFFVAVRYLGVTATQAIYSVVSMVVSFTWGIVIFQERVRSPWLAGLGLLFLVLGCCLMALTPRIEKENFIEEDIMKKDMNTENPESSESEDEEAAILQKTTKTSSKNKKKENEYDYVKDEIDVEQNQPLLQGNAPTIVQIDADDEISHPSSSRKQILAQNSIFKGFSSEDESDKEKTPNNSQKNSPQKENTTNSTPASAPPMQQQKPQVPAAPETTKVYGGGQLPAINIDDSLDNLREDLKLPNAIELMFFRFDVLLTSKPWVTFTFSILGLLISAVLNGSVYVPLHFSYSHNLAKFIFSFGWGVMLATLVLFLLFITTKAILVCVKKFGEKRTGPADFMQFQAKLFLKTFLEYAFFNPVDLMTVGIIGGVFYSFGQIGCMIAILSPLSYQVGFPLCQLAMVVSAVWGVGYFREIEGCARLSQFTMALFLFITLGSALLVNYGTNIKRSYY